MAHIPYYEGLRQIAEIYTEKTSEAIRNALTYVDREDKIDECCELFVKAPKLKKMKDRNAPKGPRSAYLLFTASVRERVQKENPEMSQTDLMKLYGLEWKALPEADREPFHVAAAVDRDRHKTESAEYAQQNFKLTAGGCIGGGAQNAMPTASGE